MKTRNLKLVCLVLETVGIVALFLPFVWGYSPWMVLAESVQDPSSSTVGYWPLALPAFLALFVWLQTLRSLFHWPLTRAELWLSTALVVLLMLVPLGFWLRSMCEHAARAREWRLLARWLFGPGLWWFGPALFAAALLIALKRKGVTSQFLAPLGLRCAYLPNAVFCLLAFSECGHNWRFLDVGAAFVAATVVLYLAEIVFFTRQGWKARSTPGPTTAQTG